MRLEDINVDGLTVTRRSSIRVMAMLGHYEVWITDVPQVSQWVLRMFGKPDGEMNYDEIYYGACDKDNEALGAELLRILFMFDSFRVAIGATKA